MKISICIPVVSSSNIKKCLDSIYASTYSNFEVVVNDSSSDSCVQEILKEYDLKIIRRQTRSFESRKLTILNSSGDLVFLLDDTRIIGKKLLERISEMNHDMIIINEQETGKSLVQRLSNLEKQASGNVRHSNLSPIINKSIIPRVYVRNVAVESIRRISYNLPLELTSKIVGLDLELIYFESWMQTKDIGFIREKEILHHGENNYHSLFRKYYRYGKSQRVLRGTAYSDFAGLGGRTRYGLTSLERFSTLPIQLIRSVPFILGYISGN